MADKQIRIRNVKAEMLIIKAFTAAKKSGRAEILERVSEDHFGSKVGKLVWKRATILHTNKNLPYKGGWNVLVNDPVLHNKQVVQDILEQFEETEVSGKSTFVLELIKTLEFYRQKREAFKSLENAYDALSDAESQDDVSEALIPIIGAARTVTDVRARDAFFRLDTLNLIETLKIAKSTRGSNNLARTLWHQFDSINSGFSFGSLVTIAATTSGGKSAVAFINMMINFALQGLKVAGASLEMSKEQIAERQAAFVSGVPMHKIRAGKWTPEEEEHINRSSQLLLELIAKQGGSYWVLKKLDKDSSIEEILLQLYEKGSHVILIDYINLLKLPKGKDKWEALGDIAREAKLFADSHNCLVILLAQLNEEEHVKYSKAIEEHSDNVIIWTYPTNNRPGFIQAKQIKARNQIPYNFYLVEDFENMRAYDLLEPTGLALMLSRSSGRAYQKKTNEYFGMRRLLEIQDTLDYDSIGVPKHRFTEDIDWSALTDQAAPAPNMPDVGVVLDMVREMINFISQYEPMTAKILLDNLKSSDILAPYRDIVDDLDLPHRAKEVLGMGDGESDTLDSRKKKLLAKIQRDLITATQDIYIEGDKRVREDRKRDRVTSRSSVYDETYEQFQARSDPEKPLRKKKKRKEVVDPSVSESKWLKMDKGYAYRKKLKADNIPVEIEEGGRSPLDAMKATPKQNIKALAKAAKSKKSVKKYRQHWTLLLEDSPPSPDSIKESMLLDGGPEEPEFLLGFDGPYLDKFESNIEIVGAFLEKKVGKVESTLGILLANHFASDKGLDNWRRGFINELKVSDLAHKMISTVTNAAPNLQGIVEKDKESLPSVENIIKHFGLKKKAKKFLSQTAKKAQRDNFRGTPFVSLDLAVPKSLPSRKRYIKILRNNGFMDNARQLLDSDMIVESPYIALFSKPQLIGSITPGNWDRMNKPGLYASAVKTGVFERILKGSHKEREQLTRSVVWALTNPEYRDNIPLLESIRQSLLSFLMSIDDRGLIMGIFN